MAERELRDWRRTIPRMRISGVRAHVAESLGRPFRRVLHIPDCVTVRQSHSCITDRIQSNRASMIGSARIKSILRIRLTIAPSSWEHNATPLSSPHILHAYYKCLSMLSLVVCSCLTSLSRVSTSSRFLFSLARCSVLALCNKVIIRMR